METPSVSVVIPTYNRAALLLDTLESVFRQTHPASEVIVADDGSSDHTEAALLPFRDRVRYVRQEHRGHDAAARNLGIRHSSCDYIAFVDSDDLWLPDKLARQLALFGERPELALVYSDGWCFDGATGQDLYTIHRFSSPQAGWVGPSLLRGNFIPTSSVMVRRAALDAVGTFSEDPVLHLRSDWEFWLRLASRYQVGYLDTPLFRYRMHAQNTTRREDPLHAHRSCVRAMRGAVAFAPELYEPQYRRALAAQYSHTASAYVALERIAEARAMYAQALRLDPRFLPAYPFLLGTLLGATPMRGLRGAYLWWQGQRSGDPRRAEG